MSARDWIAARRELLDAATEGPWLSTDVYPLVSPVQIDGFAHPVERAEAVAQAGADSALIADARTSLPMALDALHGVLAKHYEGDSSYGYAPNGDYVDLGPCCETCGTNGEYGVPWPCPTVAAIAGALGVEP